MYRPKFKLAQLKLCREPVAKHTAPHARVQRARLERKVPTPEDFHGREEAAQELKEFEKLYHITAEPFH
jgi:hypothetical protein